MKVNRLFWISYKAYVLVIFFLTLIPFYPVFYYFLSKEDRWKQCFIWQRRWGKVIRILTGIRLKIEGRENLPKPPYVIISNHASYIDTFLMYGIIPDFFVFMGMASLSKVPLFGQFFTSGQNIPVNRSSMKDSIVAFKLAEAKLKKGYSVALFPEGGIKSQVPQLASFKNGAFKLAFNAKVPLVPVVMFNTHKILESNDLFKTSGRPGLAPVHILKPIETSELKQEDLIPLRESIREAMNQDLQNFYSDHP
ncbi:MAG: 1-acyl-sn-glycerol-3-phosphate acyltransferase [Salibacteraceae bacterium]|jgi:1-acyl-sn-glycerol-3-phosphate acyltransferase